jgi:putative transposase
MTRSALLFASAISRSALHRVSAWIGTAFAQDDAAAARKLWYVAAHQARPRLPELANLMDDTNLTCWPTWIPRLTPGQDTLHQSNRTHQRRNGEIERRSEVVIVFPNEEAIIRLIGALVHKQNDKWAELSKVPPAQQMTRQRRVFSASD